MTTLLSVASTTKDKVITARTGFPKLHLHVLRSKARRLGSHLPEIPIAYLPADTFWWEVTPGVLIVSLDTVCRREVFRLDAKAGGLCLCLNLWLRPCSEPVASPSFHPAEVPLSHNSVRETFLSESLVRGSRLVTA